jgi:hypothetical protein
MGAASGKLRPALKIDTTGIGTPPVSPSAILTGGWLRPVSGLASGLRVQEAWGLRSLNWADRLPALARSGILTCLDSPTVAGAAPDLPHRLMRRTGFPFHSGIRNT